MANHFIMLRLNPFGLRVEMFPGPGYVCSEDGVV